MIINCTLGSANPLNLIKCVSSDSSVMAVECLKCVSILIDRLLSSNFFLILRDEGQ